MRSLRREVPVSNRKADKLETSFSGARYRHTRQKWAASPLWLCVTEFVAEVYRLSCMIDVASRAERLRIVMRVVRQKVRADGTPETEKDLLDWLEYAQSETTGFKLGFSKGEIAELDAQILLCVTWGRAAQAQR